MFIRQADKTRKNAVCIQWGVEDQLSVGRQGNCFCSGKGMVKCASCAMESGPWNKRWRGGPATSAAGTHGWIWGSFRQAQADHQATPSGSKGPGDAGRVFLQGRSSTPSRLLSECLLTGRPVFIYTAVLQRCSPGGNSSRFSVSKLLAQAGYLFGCGFLKLSFKPAKM